jgi:hypothetical protein
MDGHLPFPLFRAAGPASRTRRHALRMLSGAGLGLGVLNPALDAGAKKRKKKRKPKPPVLDVAIVTCPGAFEIQHAGSRRYAQTFTAPQTGVITAATVEVTVFPEAMDFLVDIRTVDGDDVPTNEVLASEALNDLPGNTATDPPRPVTAFFDPPAKVEKGTHYAFVITDATGQTFTVSARTGDECQGQAFNDATASETFNSLPDADLIFTLSVAFAK